MTLTDAQKEAIRMKVRLSESKQAQAERRRNLNHEMNGRTAHEEQEAYTASKNKPYEIEATSTINPTTLNYDNKQGTFVGRGYEPRNKPSKKNNSKKELIYHIPVYEGIGTSGYLDMQQALGEMELADKNIQSHDLYNFKRERKDVEAKFREGKLKLRLIRSREDFLDAQEKVYDFLQLSDQKKGYILDDYKNYYVESFMTDLPSEPSYNDGERLISYQNIKFKH